MLLSTGITVALCRTNGQFSIQKTGALLQQLLIVYKKM